MSNLKNLPSSGNNRKNKQALKGGAYSLIITAVVLAILIAVNFFVSALPSSLTKYDISAAKLYSITSNTKAVVNALDEDVTIYWIVQSGEEDEIIENLLGKYEGLSEHIKVVKKNPDAYPAFARQYTDEEVYNNSLIVECGERSRYIGIDDIFLGQIDLSSYTYSTTDFDGEGAITSAIDYVTSEEFPQLYVLEGHGEEELPETLLNQIEKENMEINALSLLTADKIPEDAACVIIHAPASDISAEEKKMLADYVENKGKLLVISGSTEDGILENLYSLLSDYGVEAHEGFVVDNDRQHYAFGYPYILMPDMNSSAVTDSLIEEKYYPIMPLSIGLTVSGNTGTAVVTELLTTSADSLSKAAGYDLSSYEYEEGDAKGPFALGVSIETTGGGAITWFSSDDFIQDMYNSFSSGANMDMTMNALSSLIGESDAMAIRSKSLSYNYLTISEDVSSLLKVLMVGVFPLTYLGAGIAIIIKRKRVHNETN